ncbi:MAG: CrcB family protein [Deltaproteobacteria bacterium]|nr:CrcB family protein [Deltaproteobacteria bacterium]
METWRQLLGVFVAGGVGACLRVVIATAIDERGDRIPLGTWAVNLLGCLAIGILAAWVPRGPWRTIAIGGLLGGFTTYSSFALLSWELTRDDRLGAAALLVAGHVVGGLVAVAIGAWLGGLLQPST